MSDWYLLEERSVWHWLLREKIPCTWPGFQTGRQSHKQLKSLELSQDRCHNYQKKRNYIENIVFHLDSGAKLKFTAEIEENQAAILAISTVRDNQSAELKEKLQIYTTGPNI